MRKMRRAAVEKRIFLTGSRGVGFRILVKDNRAETAIAYIEAPSFMSGRAMVRALRELDTQRGTIF